MLVRATAEDGRRRPQPHEQWEAGDEQPLGKQFLEKTNASTKTSATHPGHGEPPCQKDGHNEEPAVKPIGMKSVPSHSHLEAFGLISSQEWLRA